MSLRFCRSSCDCCSLSNSSCLAEVTDKCHFTSPTHSLSESDANVLTAEGLFLNVHELRLWNSACLDILCVELILFITLSRAEPDRNNDAFKKNCFCIRIVTNLSGLRQWVFPNHNTRATNHPTSCERKCRGNMNTTTLGRSRIKPLSRLVHVHILACKKSRYLQFFF